MKQRIYTIATEAKPTQPVRLVQAGSRAQALNHAARGMFKVAAASAVDVGKLMAAGTPLESAAKLGAEQ